MTYFRDLAQLSQAEVARRMGRDPSSVCRWESLGSTAQTPGIETIEHWCEVVGITLARFFGRVPQRRLERIADSKRQRTERAAVRSAQAAA